MIKKYILVLSIMISSFCYCQSPYYSISFSVGDANRPASSFTISAETCNFNYEPDVPSGDYWFGNDTSKLSWASLPDSMYNILKCSGSRAVAGSKYSDSNQDMVWERIYKFKIVRNQSDTMTVVFPVLIKSFVTYINLGKIPFAKGYFELTEGLEYTIDKSLHIILPPGYVWHSIKFEDRKIKLNN